MEDTFKAAGKLLQEYRRTTKREVISSEREREVLSLYGELRRLGKLSHVGAAVQQVRDIMTGRNFEFGARENALRLNRRAEMWRIQESLVAPYVTLPRLYELQDWALDQFKKADENSTHPLAGTDPLDSLLGQLKTETWITVGIGY